MEIKLQHILTLTQLLSKGARHNFIEITTSELGEVIGRSQQGASKHLVELELLGYVERVKQGQKYSVKVTEAGFQEIERLHSSLRSALDQGRLSTLDFEGTVVAGMGEGSYYMSLEGYRRQFKEKLGYEPFPGTLNVKLVKKSYMNARRDLGKYPSVLISGFSDGSRTYGWVKCYRAIVNNGAVKDPAVLVLERTHYDDSMLELISPVSIKEQTGLKNGDPIKVQVILAEE